MAYGKIEKIIGMAFLAVLTSFGCSVKGELPDVDQQHQYQQAMQFYVRGDLQRSEEVLEGLYCSGNLYPEAWNLYGRILFYSGKTEKAIDVWNQLIFQDCLDADSAKVLCRIYISEKETEKAIGILNKTISFSSRDPGLIFLLGLAFIEQGDISDGLVMLEKAAAIVEQQSEIYLLMAKIYSGYGLNEKTVESLNRCLSLLGDDHPLAGGVRDLKTQIEGAM